MRVFTAFLLTLVQRNYEDTRDQQLRFYANPEKLMREFRHDTKELSQRQKSIICSLMPDEILKEAKKDTADLPADFEANLGTFVGRINNDNDWPKQGYTDRDPWLEENEDDPCGPADEKSDDSDNTDDTRFGIMWSAPKARILWVFERRARRGQTIDLKITGEGFLPGARVMLGCRDVDTPYAIAEDSTDFILCNIRRTFIRVESFKIPALAPVGEYWLFVTNPGWKHFVKWDNAFHIEE